MLDNGYQYLQKISTSGEFKSDTVRVKYNSTNKFYSYTAALTNIINEHFFMASNAQQRNDANVYKQKFNINLEPEDSSINIADDFGSVLQKKPLVRINSRGDVIVVWEDSRNGRNDLYAQVYDKDFNAVGDNIQINETNADYWSLNDKAIKYFSDGAFVIVFSGSDEYSDGTDVYIQLIDTRGEKVGNNKLVKAKNYNDKFNVDLNINSADEILIVWYNQYGAALKKFSKDLSLLTNEKNF